MAVVIDNLHTMYPCEAIHQQYTDVLTLLHGTTGFNHTPSWSEIVSHLVVILHM